VPTPTPALVIIAHRFLFISFCVPARLPSQSNNDDLIIENETDWRGLATWARAGRHRQLGRASRQSAGSEWLAREELASCSISAQPGGPSSFAAAPQLFHVANNKEPLTQTLNSRYRPSTITTTTTFARLPATENSKKKTKYKMQKKNKIIAAKLKWSTR
jgi:hypothetical protein